MEGGWNWLRMSFVLVRLVRGFGHSASLLLCRLCSGDVYGRFVSDRAPPGNPTTAHAVLDTLTNDAVLHDGRSSERRVLATCK
jgi:hypothetical protein